MGRRAQVTGGDEDSWLMTYADSITLLMAFFVLLLSVSSIDQAKIEAMKTGIDKTFSRRETEQPFSSIVERLNEVVEEQQLQEHISITPDPLGVKLRFSSQLLYELGTATIKEKMLPILGSVSQAIEDSGYEDYVVKIEGHTDNIPIHTPQYSSNWELSAHRATNIVKILEKTGIPKKRLWAIAFADSHPLVPNIDEYGKAIPANQSKNRRIEVYIQRSFK